MQIDSFLFFFPFMRDSQLELVGQCKWMADQFISKQNYKRKDPMSFPYKPYHKL
jgi:hypothetical protein